LLPAPIPRSRPAAVPRQVRERLAPLNCPPLEKIVGPANLREILALPDLAARLIGRPVKGKTDIAAAALYGWIAFMIYDRFLDREGDDPALLPVANLAQREMNRFFLGRLPGLAEQVFDRMDRANAWEAAHCRCRPDAPLADLSLPDYGDCRTLADRSLGHALPVLAALSEDTPESAAVLEFFEHYLIARQLNDDAHDWQADLDHGQINAVAVPLLARLAGDGRRLYDPTLRQELVARFWKREIISVISRARHELERARACLAGLPSLQPAALESLLAPVERSLSKAETGRRETLGFLAAYRKNV